LGYKIVFQNYRCIWKKAFAAVANSFDYFLFKLLIVNVFENVAEYFESVATAQAHAGSVLAVLRHFAGRVPEVPGEGGREVSRVTVTYAIGDFGYGAGTIF